jgi:DNA (cytosine-5)-methyltransferase 1
MAKSKRNHTSSPSRPIAIDLFCGAGGMSLGFEQAGFDVRLAVDFDGYHVATHVRNFPYAPAICGSVKDMTGSSLRAAAGIADHEEVDLLFGGPPCQGFSQMGLRDSKDLRSTLVFDFVRIVSELRPRVFVMENVPGLLAGDMKPVLEFVVDLAVKAGYEVTTPVRILTASNFGVPQERSRVFVLGKRSDIPGRLEYPTRSVEGQPPRPTVWEAIGDLPSIERDDQLFKEDQAAFDKPPESDYAKVARGVLVDPSDRSRPRVWNAEVCSGCMRTRHSDESVALYAATPPGGVAPGHKLPRLHPEGLCPTLRAGSDSSRGSYTSPRPLHPFVPRCITAREAARLHGYPDWFSFYPSKLHALKQIGNSVCPPVARAVGAKIFCLLRPSETVADRGESVQLQNAFVLPDNRPRHQKRLAHSAHYPPLVTRLFSMCFDLEKGRLLKRGFTFQMVEQAITESGVTVPWLRADNFIAEIARSRNLIDLLAEPRRAGLSIRPGSGDEIGIWVSESDPAAIHNAKSLGAVRIADVKAAIPVEVSARHLSSMHSAIPSLLDCQAVQRALWQRDLKEVRVERDTFDFAEATDLRVEIATNGRKRQRVSVVLSTVKGAVTKERLSRAARRDGCSDVLLFRPLTARHIFIGRYSACDAEPREDAACVFECAAV